jgi:hypothetical protein
MHQRMTHTLLNSRCEVTKKFLQHQIIRYYFYYVRDLVPDTMIFSSTTLVVCIFSFSIVYFVISVIIRIFAAKSIIIGILIDMNAIIFVS